MKRSTSGPGSQTLEEAAVWFVTLRGGDVEESARRAFHDWLKRSPDHVLAYLELASVYADIPAPAGGRTPVDLIEKATSPSHSNVVPLVAGERVPMVKAEPRTTRRWISAAAALAMVAVGMWLYTQRDTYGTTVGEQRSITLSDGSIVELDACSRIRVAFQARERDIELLSGQALFQVAKNPSRPFIVSAGNAKVRAVGTQFDVDRTEGGTTVTVLEGRVTVHQDGTRRAEPANGAQAIGPLPYPDDLLLAAGEQMTVTRLHIEKLPNPDISAAIAWTQHRLIFDGTPLGKVVEEFNRYSRHRLVIDSPDLVMLRISGQYTSADPASLIRFLSLQNDIVVVDRDGETHIRRE